jgi:hypothetical protein
MYTPVLPLARQPNVDNAGLECHLRVPRVITDPLDLDLVQ